MTVFVCNSPLPFPATIHPQLHKRDRPLLFFFALLKSVGLFVRYVVARAPIKFFWPVFLFFVHVLAVLLLVDGRGSGRLDGSSLSGQNFWRLMRHLYLPLKAKC